MINIRRAQVMKMPNTRQQHIAAWSYKSFERCQKVE